MGDGREMRDGWDKADRGKWRRDERGTAPTVQQLDSISELPSPISHL